MSDRPDDPDPDIPDKPATATAGSDSPPRRPRGRTGGWLVLLVLLAGALALNVAFGQLTPYTSEATLQAPVIAIAPNVSGDIVEVGIDDNERVAAGELLFRIDPALFEAALRKAEADLEQAVLEIGAGTAGLGAAEAGLVEARAMLADIEVQHQRTTQLLERGYATRSAFDDSQARLAGARADVHAAEAQLEEARQRLGPGGEDNPRIRAALAAREKAQIDLRHTRVTAPVDGVVTNTVLSVGQFASAGRRMATLVDTARAWIVAQMPENALGGIASGDRVDIVLDVAPGRIFNGRVHSVASGIEEVVGAGLAGELPTAVERREWLRDVRRIPVRIRFDELGPDIPVRVGGGASVAIYTAEAGALAPLTRAWMRTVAYARHAF